jgi:hypothetical protein
MPHALVETAELAHRLDRIQRLTDELAKVRGDALEQKALSERIHREIQAARVALDVPKR